MQLTLYQQHKKDWAKGCGDRCCKLAKRIVFARGTVPCDVLFLGEGPGESENIIGQPFCGPAGKILDYIIEKVFTEVNGERGSDGEELLTWAIYNVVGCLPRNDDGGKEHNPTEEQMESCKPRLEEFIDLAQPRVIVALGKTVSSWLEQGYLHSVKLPKVEGAKPKIVNVYHPAYIIRLPLAGQGLVIDECCVTIEDAIFAQFTKEQDKKVKLRAKYEEAYQNERRRKGKTRR